MVEINTIARQATIILFIIVNTNYSKINYGSKINEELIYFIKAMLLYDI